MALDEGFTLTDSKRSIMTTNPAQRNKCISIADMYGEKTAHSLIGKRTVHDANFAFLTTTLAKLHESLYEPLTNTTYAKDIPVDVGGGFVDYVAYYTVDYAGVMDEFRNIYGNNANVIPRVNAGMNKVNVNVYTFEVGFDLEFIELEKMKKLTLQKSIQDIYNNIIVAGWDLFVQKVAYLGTEGRTGLFNATTVQTTTIDNTGTTGKGFEGLDDKAIVGWFNGVFETALAESNMNTSILPDTFLVPTFVGADLVARMSALYTSTLREFIVEHNLGVAESAGELKVTIQSRPQLNTLGDAGKGRIVAYRKEKRFVRVDIPYPIQHYITLPNCDKMCYTSLFAGQVSEIQLPYSQSADEFGPVQYYDFIA